MNFVDLIKEKLEQTYTENGDKAYSTTGSACLDYFAAIGSLRTNLNEVIRLFTRALFENKVLSVETLFYSRDILGGLGERSSFRLTINYIANFFPGLGRELIPYIIKYGRYDDLLALIDTPLELDMISFIKGQLSQDLENKKQGKPISLLGKWLPSINASSSETRHAAKTIAEGLEMSLKDYRKMCTTLRSGIIIENNLREKDYTFDYSKTPSGAMLKYKKAFINNDNERYLAYLESVKEGKTKINTSTLYPYQVVRDCLRENESQEFYNSLDVTWKALKREDISDNIIVVRDGSGSMMWGWSNPTPNEVATSLAIYFAERLTGPFHNTFLTFSEKTKLVELPDADIKTKVQYAMNYNDCANTNIASTFELLYQIYDENKIEEKDMITKLVIISDMEFDACVEGCSTFEFYKKKFSDKGYVLPEIVFWDVAMRNVHFPVQKNEQGVTLVSGASQHVIDSVTNNKYDNPYDYMVETLSKYDELKNLKSLQ